eukprot:1586377-Rhodomonas_salina.1
MTRDGAPLTLGWCHDGRGVRDDTPVSSLTILLAGRLTATGHNRTQIAGDADPHYVQTSDTHASEMGYGNSGGFISKPR